MKVYFRRKSSVNGVRIIAVETKAARTNKVSSLHPEFDKKKDFNLLLCKVLPTKVINGVECLSL